MPIKTWENVATSLISTSPIHKEKAKEVLNIGLRSSENFSTMFTTSTGSNIECALKLKAQNSPFKSHPSNEAVGKLT